jgi:polysaccharide biosynthesis protein VpsQ
MQNIRLLQIVYCTFILLAVVLADLGLMSWFREYASQYPGIDKAIHFILVGGLSWVLIFAFNAKRMNLLGSSLYVGTILTFALVTLEECSQLLIATRRFELLDLLADYLGILVAEILTRRACVSARRSNA